MSSLEVRGNHDGTTPRHQESPMTAEPLGTTNEGPADRGAATCDCVTCRDQTPSRTRSAHQDVHIASLRLSIVQMEQNSRILKHEIDTPMRGHDEDGGCCLRAKLGVVEN